MLSMHDNEQYFFESLKVGASRLRAQVGRRPRTWSSACRAALRGESFLYPGAMSALVRDYLERMRRGERVPGPCSPPREDEVDQADRRGQLLEGDRAGC